MIQISNNIEIDEQTLSDFCRRWKIREFSLFGSVLRSDFSPDSDIDVLVTLNNDAAWSLYDWIDMIEELKRLFGRDVDLIEKTAIRNPFRRNLILENHRVLYAA